MIRKDMFYKEENNAELFDTSVDFVIDAIDTMSSKLSLIRYCIENRIPFISSMGMANRLDPTQV
ncbi:tRNA threonylcarbamoyladenosine dehydratase, partial [Desulfovibrio desulfuricans]|nr:tRNA threonylcarbamoyladenosine dehydratase [Desulfovibrio desulfuricans]